MLTCFIGPIVHLCMRLFLYQYLLWILLWRSKEPKEEGEDDDEEEEQEKKNPKADDLMHSNHPL